MRIPEGRPGGEWSGLELTKSLYDTAQNVSANGKFSNYQFQAQNLLLSDPGLN